MKNVTTKEVTQKQEVHTYICDGCGVEIDEEVSSFERETVELSIRQRHTAKITLKAENAEHFPEGGWSEYEVIDCCMQCWERKAKPALIAAGFKVREDRSDW